MPLRLICCSDTHTAGPPGIDESGKLAWLHAGDVHDGLNPLVLSAEERAVPELAQAANLLAGGMTRWLTRSIPIYAVRGNHDVADEIGFFAACSDVSGRLARLADGLFVAGVGWHGGRYCDLPLESDLRQVCNIVRRLALRQLCASDRLILLTHYPAWAPPAFAATTQARDVFGAVRALASELRPLAIIQGHIHEWAGHQHAIDLDGAPSLVVTPGPMGGVLSVELATGEACFEPNAGITAPIPP